MEKYKNLDGLRGLAALIVVLCHYSNAFTPFIHGWADTTTHTRFDRIFATTPLHLIVGGDFAVAIFFVLSGFVLSNKFFRTKDTMVVISSAMRRYLRLMLPALGSILLVYIFMRTGAVQDNASHSSSWMVQFWNFPASLFTAVYQGMYGVFFTNYFTFNPVLWTMHYELFGSFLVFLFLVIFGKIEKRWLMYGLFVIVFAKTYYLPFLLGMAISDIWINRPDYKELIGSKIATGMLAAGLLFGGWYISDRFTGMYNLITLPTFDPHELATLSQTIGAVLVMVGIMRLPALARFFTTKPLQYLGRVSFALYLTHFVILGSFANILFTYMIKHFGLAISSILTSLISISLTLIISSLFTKYVDDKAILTAKQFGDWMLSAKPSRKSMKKPAVAEYNPELANGAIPQVQTVGLAE